RDALCSRPNSCHAFWRNAPLGHTASRSRSRRQADWWSLASAVLPLPRRTAEARRGAAFARRGVPGAMLGPLEQRPPPTGAFHRCPPPAHTPPEPASRQAAGNLRPGVRIARSTPLAFVPAATLGLPPPGHSGLPERFPQLLRCD